MEEFTLSFDWANRDIVSVIIGIVIGIVIFFVGRRLAKFISNLAARSMERADVDPLVIQFVKVLVYSAMLVSVVIAALNAAGIHTTSFTALLASAGLAIGLAVKDSLANFASGVMILLTKPYRRNDYVEAAGVGGTVTEVNIFNTVMVTPDNIQVIVPNSQVTGDTIMNYSANDTRRVDLTVGIGYEDNIGQARDTLLDIMVGHPLVLAEPNPTVAVLDLADSSVNLAVRCWANTPDYWTVRVEILELIKSRFEQAGINLPYPQQEIYVRQLNGQDN